MKKGKKPIYLWILGIMSLILSLLGVYGVFSPAPDFSAVDLSSLPQEQVKLVQQSINYQTLAYEFNHNILNRILAVVAAILIITVIVFLVRKEIMRANFAYFAYVLLGIIGSIYAYVGARSGILVAYTDEDVRSGVLMQTGIIIAIYVVLNLVFLGIVGYKIYRQNQEVDETEE
ncbi:ABC transporter permease [Streptococcus sp. DD10]|uniref:ABC transporter permease n=1 Tax=Streptococcus sp. DD10 TaxID=1777878 RepID=UPI0008359070|nr:hypothetical protein [Streptococcus sp. DD10]